jgi:predicted dehydrogenase
MLSASTAASVMNAAGANDRIRLAIIGAGARGRWLMNYANEVGGIEWVAVADVYGKRSNEAERVAGKDLVKYGDYRQLLERKDIDAVIIASPDHWHAQMIVDAARAGKDIFIEKPLTSAASQGHRIVKTVQETQRVVQVGTQQRSIPVLREAKEKFFDSGLIGRVTMVHCYWNLNGGYIIPPVPAELQAKPEDLDWDNWLGVLPKIDWDPKRFIRPFAFWGPSTGPTGNLLVHFLEVIHWYLGLRRPLSAIAMGGLYHFRDGRDIPDNFSCALEYPEQVLVSYGCCVPDQGRREGVDLVFMGTGGRLHAFRDGYRFVPAKAERADQEIIASGKDGNYHMQNWIECIRSRKTPNANVVDAHYLSAACHLANASYFQHERAYWPDTWDLESA